MIYIYRIKHIPTGLYFKSSGSHHKSSLDLAGQLYTAENKITHSLLGGKIKYSWIILRSTFKQYNIFKESYKYIEYIIKDCDKTIVYSKFHIPKSEFKIEIFETIN